VCLLRGAGTWLTAHSRAVRHNLVEATVRLATARAIEFASIDVLVAGGATGSDWAEAVIALLSFNFGDLLQLMGGLGIAKLALEVALVLLLVVLRRG